VAVLRFRRANWDKTTSIYGRFLLMQVVFRNRILREGHAVGRHSAVISPNTAPIGDLRGRDASLLPRP